MPRPFRLPVTRRVIERDLNDELALHVALRAEQLEREGLPPHAARAEAERLFGNPEAIRADCLAIDEAHRLRAARWNALDEVRQDVAFALRTLRRDVSFSLLAVCILALGIGATTAIFSIYDRVVLRPLDVTEVERVAWVATTRTDGDMATSPAAFIAWSERARAFERLASVRPTAATLLGVGEPARLEGLQVGDGFFEVLRTRATVGRVLQGSDFAAGGAPTVLLSAALWKERFGGQASVVGRSVSLDGTLREVVGIMPPSLDALGGAAQFVVPDRLPTQLRENWTPFLSAIGRLRPGVTYDGAERELEAALDERWRATRREPRDVRARAMPLTQYLTLPFRDRVTLLLASVASLLLIGCVNVGNLLLSRGAARGRELAVRASLGASRARLVRQLVTEHALLALVSGTLGVLAAIWMVRGLALILPPDLPHLSAAHIDVRAIVAAITCGVVTLLVAGLLPAVRASRVDTREALQGGGRGSTAARATDRLRRGFVIAQVAATTVLLVVAGLLVRSTSRLGEVAPGFALDEVLTARYSLPEREYDTPTKVLLAHARIREGVGRALGEPVALSSSIPLGNGGGGSGFVVIGGERAREGEVNAGLRFVSPGYLKAMGITLLRGRDLDEGDGRRASRVVVVSETLARMLGFGDDAVGRSIGGTASPFKDSTGAPVALRIVGVVREPRDRGLREAGEPQVFFPLEQTPDEVFDWNARSVHVVARSTARVRTLEGISRGVHGVDPKLPIEDVRTMRERLQAYVALERANTTLLAALGIAALLLAVSGLYGVIAFGVRQRESEIGVRLALGAQPRDIVSMVVRWGGRLVVIGLVLGVPMALGASRALAGLLYGVTPFDVATITTVVLVLAFVALVSAWIPARRAAGITPGSVLQG